MYREYFGEIPDSPINKIISDKNAMTMHKQNRDWTCSIACLRTILGTQKTEDWFVNIFHMKPGPYYSGDFKKIADQFKGFSFLFGCDDSKCDDVEKFYKILSLIKDGWSVMIETMYNYAHWLVILGFYPCGNKISNCNILLWDPYSGNTRMKNMEEVISMWIDGDFAHTKIKNDYIAAKRRC